MSVAFEPALRLARRTPFFFAVSLLVSACGGAGPSPANGGANASTSAKTAEPGSQSRAKAPEPTAAESPQAALSFPTACAKEGSEICVPPASFAKHLCAAPNAAALALALFAKGTPWVRMYLARNTEAWDATGSGGASMKLAFDEEVLVLAYRPTKPGGMIVSGADGAYDVLRWDGTCASLAGDEVRKWYPPEPGWAEIPWRKLDDEMQQKLLGDGRISLKEGEMKKACKGLSRTQTNAACEKAQKSLSKAIVAYVRVGGALAEPKMP